MRRVATVAAVAALGSVLMPEALLAQTCSAVMATVTHELRLQDGSRAFGCVARESDTEVEFETIAGVRLVAKWDQVLSLRPAQGRLHNGEFQPADPNNTRLFYGPTGRALPRGQVYLGIYEFVMPFLQVGVTDRFSIGGGTPLVFGIGEGLNRPFWITPKLQLVDGRKVQVSVGAFQAFGGGDTAGIGYGVVTTGGVDGSLTVGTGVAYNGKGDRTVVAMVGGDRPIGRNLKLVSENYIWGSGDGLASAGVRFFGERVSADLALATPLGSAHVFVFPMLNFVYRF